MSKYTVNFIVRDWITIDVSAETEDAAKEVALKKVNKSGYKDNAIDIVDGKTEYAGITLNDVIDLIN